MITLAGSWNFVSRVPVVPKSEAHAPNLVSSKGVDPVVSWCNALSQVAAMSTGPSTARHWAPLAVMARWTTGPAEFDAPAVTLVVLRAVKVHSPVVRTVTGVLP